MGYEADHEFDADQAREWIKRSFPDFGFTNVEFLAQGWDFRMYQVDSVWLFRFPKRKEEVVRLEREIAFLGRVADDLPVAVPRYEWRATEVAGYRKLEGAPMVGSTPTPRFAETLGDALAALHAIPKERFEGLTLPGVIETGGLPKLRDEIIGTLERAREKLDPELHARCAAVLAAPIPPADDAPTAVIHNDIYPAHILLDDDGGLCGLIDWADANLGDPAPDFATASLWGGEEYLQRALDRYPLPRDAAFEDRARTTARYEAIAHITYGAIVKKPEYVVFGVAALDRG